MGRGRTSRGASRSRARGRSDAGRRTTSGSRFAAASETAHELAAADACAAELDVPRRVAIDDRRRGLEPERLLDRVRNRLGLAPVARRARRNRESTWWSAFAIIPSVVSIPPKSSTAAFETTSSLPSAPAPCAAPARSEVSAGARRAPARSRRPSSSNAARPFAGRLAAGADLGHLRDDRAIPAERHVRRHVVETERDGHRGDRQRPARAWRGDRPAPSGHDLVEERGRTAPRPRREPLANRVEAKRSRERRSMPSRAPRRRATACSAPRPARSRTAGRRP